MSPSAPKLPSPRSLSPRAGSADTRVSGILACLFGLVSAVIGVSSILTDDMPGWAVSIRHSHPRLFWCGVAYLGVIVLALEILSFARMFEAPLGLRGSRHPAP